MTKRYTTFYDLPPQEQTVLEHLVDNGSITAGEAQMVHRIRSLSRRITTLLDAGCVIEKEDRWDMAGQRYRRYRLVTAPNRLMPPVEEEVAA